MLQCFYFYFWSVFSIFFHIFFFFLSYFSNNNGRLSYEGNGERCCKKSERVTMKWRCAYGGGYIERRKWVGVGSSIMPLCQEAPIIWIMAFAPQIIQLGLPFSILFPILICFIIHTTKLNYYSYIFCPIWADWILSRTIFFPFRSYFCTNQGKERFF